MITVSVNTINLTSGELTDKLVSATANTVANGLAETIREKISNKVCSKHPNANQEITITANENLKPTIEKRNFCCDDFKNSIQINI